MVVVVGLELGLWSGAFWTAIQSSPDLQESSRELEGLYIPHWGKQLPPGSLELARAGVMAAVSTDPGV